MSIKKKRHVYGHFSFYILLLNFSFSYLFNFLPFFFSPNNRSHFTMKSQADKVRCVSHSLKHLVDEVRGFHCPMFFFFFMGINVPHNFILLCYTLLLQLTSFSLLSLTTTIYFQPPCYRSPLQFIFIFLDISLATKIEFHFPCHHLH